VFVANGDHERRVPSHNSADLARRLPNAQLTIYPDAGHEGILRYHAEFVPAAWTSSIPDSTDPRGPRS